MKTKVKTKTKYKWLFGILVIVGIVALIPTIYLKNNVPASPFEESMKQDQFIVPVSQEDLKYMKDASTLLISCVDFRLRHPTEKLMRTQLHLLDDYDEIAVPGASLALTETGHPHWQQTINDIITIVEKLHNIKRIILLDHRDCGAYKLIKGGEYSKTKSIETSSHQATLLEAKAALEKKFPKLKIYTMLMGLDGVVENFHE